MTMARLTGQTVVADRYGVPVLLREGDPLPEWAVGRVGKHLLAEDDKPARKAPGKAPAKSAK